MTGICNTLFIKFWDPIDKIKWLLFSKDYTNQTGKKLPLWYIMIDCFHILLGISSVKNSICINSCKSTCSTKVIIWRLIAYFSKMKKIMLTPHLRWNNLIPISLFSVIMTAVRNNKKASCQRAGYLFRWYEI